MTLKDRETLNLERNNQFIWIGIPYFFDVIDRNVWGPIRMHTNSIIQIQIQELKRL